MAPVMTRTTVPVQRLLIDIDTEIRNHACQNNMHNDTSVKNYVEKKHPIGAYCIYKLK